MLTRLTHILLALVTAFVFTGQMEAAAQHCARLAEEAAAAAPASDAPPCHETEQAAATHHSGMTHHDAKNTSKAPDTCECIAALKICMDIEGPTASSVVAPYAWLTEGEASFASAKPDPDLRPPRA